MARYWISWWSDLEAEAPYPRWVTGHRSNPPGSSLCAVVDAPTQADAWSQVRAYFPDYEERFCEVQEPDFAPRPDRFPPR